MSTMNNRFKLARASLGQEQFQASEKLHASAMLLELKRSEDLNYRTARLELKRSASEGTMMKKRKINDTSLPPRKRVSFSNAQKVVEVERTEDTRNSWYATEDYSNFVYRAHQEAAVLKNAAECATSAESLFHFIQNNPNLNPRGLEKVMHHGGAGEDEPSRMTHYSRKIRTLKCKHRRVLLDMHRDQKQMGQSNPEELRKFSEDSSRWAVQTALKLGHIDAKGLI